MSSEMLCNAGVTRIRSSTETADEIVVGHVINTVANTRVKTFFLYSLSRVRAKSVTLDTKVVKESSRRTLEAAVLDSWLNLIIYQAVRTSLSRQKTRRARMQ